MVESEIARLEGQISEIKLGLKHEQEANKESEYKKWLYGIPSSPNIGHSSNIATSPNPVNNFGVHERIAFETKALHFINKAIKGDYNLNDFGVNDRNVDLNGFGNRKENYFHEEIKRQDKVSRKNGMLKPPSPLRDPRHPSPRVWFSFFNLYHLILKFSSTF